MVAKTLLGPSGRAIAHPMEPELAKGLNQHITMERNASQFYFGFSLWFLQKELKGFSKFFQKESLEEQKHARCFSEYLVARSQNVYLEELKAPVIDTQEIVDILSFSLRMESDLSSSINQLYVIAEKNSDIRTTVFLDPSIENQIKSEDLFAYLLGRVKFAENNTSSLLIIDNEISNNEFKPAVKI